MRHRLSSKCRRRRLTGRDRAASVAAATKVGGAAVTPVIRSGTSRGRHVREAGRSVAEHEPLGFAPAGVVGGSHTCDRAFSAGRQSRGVRHPDGRPAWPRGGSHLCVPGGVLLARGGEPPAWPRGAAVTLEASLPEVAAKRGAGLAWPRGAAVTRGPSLSSTSVIVGVVVRRDVCIEVRGGRCARPRRA